MEYDIGRGIASQEDDELVMFCVGIHHSRGRSMVCISAHHRRFFKGATSIFENPSQVSHRIAGYFVTSAYL